MFKSSMEGLSDLRLVGMSEDGDGDDGDGEGLLLPFGLPAGLVLVLVQVGEEVAFILPGIDVLFASSLSLSSSRAFYR